MYAGAGRTKTRLCRCLYTCLYTQELIELYDQIEHTKKMGIVYVGNEVTGAIYINVTHEGVTRARAHAHARTARHGTARHRTAPHGIARHRTAPHGTARHGTHRMYRCDACKCDIHRCGIYRCGIYRCERWKLGGVAGCSTGLADIAGMAAGNVATTLGMDVLSHWACMLHVCCIFVAFTSHGMLHGMLHSMLHVAQHIACCTACCMLRAMLHSMLHGMLRGGMLHGMLQAMWGHC